MLSDTYTSITENQDPGNSYIFCTLNAGLSSEIHHMSVLLHNTDNPKAGNHRLISSRDASCSCYDRDHAMCTVLLCVGFDLARGQRGQKKMEQEREERFCIPHVLG